MRRTLLVFSLAAVMMIGGGGHFPAWGQIGGIGSDTRPGAGGATTPSRFGAGASGATTPSRLGAGAPGGTTGPASGGAFTPLDETAPGLPSTTPPPGRGPRTAGDSTLPDDRTAPGAGGGLRFGEPPTTDDALDPSGLPGRSTVDDPAFGPTDRSVPGTNVDPAADPLTEGGGALPSVRDRDPLDNTGTLPGPGGAESMEMDPAGGAVDRRLAKMVYRNHLATFHLVYGQGTAHYHLEHAQPGVPHPHPFPCVDGHCPIHPQPSLIPHLAVLRFRESNDPHYWHYTAYYGDQFTIEWAFAKRRSHDGGFAVYRQTRNAWARYGSFGRQVVR